MRTRTDPSCFARSSGLCRTSTAPTRSRATTVQVDLNSGGSWHLTYEGSTHWSLDEGVVDQPDAFAAFSDDAGWRWLTGASLPHHGVLMRGPADLTEPLLGVRGILA